MMFVTSILFAIVVASIAMASDSTDSTTGAPVPNTAANLGPNPVTNPTTNQVANPSPNPIPEPVPSMTENSLRKLMNNPTPEMMTKNLNAFSDALRVKTAGASASDPATAPGPDTAITSLAASLAAKLFSAAPNQQSSNLNLGQMGDLLTRIIQTVLERMLRNEGPTRDPYSQQVRPAPQSSGNDIFLGSGIGSGIGSLGLGSVGYPMAAPSAPSMGFGNMFNPLGSLFGGGGFNPFSMMLPSLMFDAFDFI